MPKPFRVLFVCTGNSARSQMAEALLAARGGGRFAAESAGSYPAGRVSRRAVAVLGELGIDWSGRTPRAVQGLERDPWDLVITVCDGAREACPVFPGARAIAHWDLADPVGAVGSDDEIRTLFRRSRDTIAGLIDRLVALPVEALEPQALAERVKEIGAALSP